MPHDTAPGRGKGETKLRRALYALPLLGFVVVAHYTMGAALASMPATDVLENSVVLDKGVTIPLWKKYTGWKSLDNILAFFAAVFSSSIGDFDPAGRLQTIAFVGGDFPALQTIFAIESARRGNILTVAHILPNVFHLLAQAKGLAFVGPIYYFFHYVQCPVENYAAGDKRTVDIRTAKTIIPTILLSYVVPTIAMYTVPGIVNRQWINGLFWQAFAIYGSLLQRVLRIAIKQTDPDVYLSNPQADMPILRRAYGFAVAIAGCTYWYVYLLSPVPLKQVFFHNLSHPSASASIMTAFAKGLRYDQLCSFGAGFAWTLLSFSDLKRAGLLEAGWGKILAVLAGATLAIGPGGAMAIMWAWREEVLAEKKVVKVSKN